MSVKAETKQQAAGAFWAIVVVVIGALIIWGVTQLNDENSWDNDPESEAQNELLEQLVTDQAESKQSSLRTEQRVITKDIGKLNRKEKLTEQEQDYVITLEQQLEVVESQLPKKEGRDGP